jgi:hypothetical protein
MAVIGGLNGGVKEERGGESQKCSASFHKQQFPFSLDYQVFSRTAPSSAGFQPAVLPIAHRPTIGALKRFGMARSGGGLETRETAGLKPALRRVAPELSPFVSTCFAGGTGTNLPPLFRPSIWKLKIFREEKLPLEVRFAKTILQFFKTHLCRANQKQIRSPRYWNC